MNTMQPSTSFPQIALLLLITVTSCTTSAPPSSLSPLGYSQLVPGGAPTAGFLNLECGVFDLAPILTKPEHLGAMVLLALIGPIDVSCKRARESAWLMRSCSDLRGHMEKKRGDFESLTSLCARGSRKIKRAFHAGCSGVASATPSQASILTGLALPQSSIRAMKLFCTFTADCTLDAFLEGCMAGFVPVARFFEFCDSNMEEKLTQNCLKEHSGGIPSIEELLSLNRTRGGDGEGGKGKGEEGGNRTPPKAVESQTRGVYLRNLAGAMEKARGLIPVLRPFVKLPSGLLAGTMGGAGMKAANITNNAKKKKKKKRKQRQEEKGEKEKEEEGQRF